MNPIKQSHAALLEERATGGLSRKRLSNQTNRFLSVADKLYPAWQVGYIVELWSTMFLHGAGRGCVVLGPRAPH